MYGSRSKVLVIVLVPRGTERWVVVVTYSVVPHVCCGVDLSLYTESELMDLWTELHEHMEESTGTVFWEDIDVPSTQSMCHFLYVVYDTAYDMYLQRIHRVLA